MPTPLPDPDDADLTPPDADEVVVLGRGVLGAVTPASGLTTTQSLLVGAAFDAMTGHPVDLAPASSVPSIRRRPRRARTLEFRTRIVQVMVLLALVLRP